MDTRTTKTITERTYPTDVVKICGEKKRQRQRNNTPTGQLNKEKEIRHITQNKQTRRNNNNTTQTRRHVNDKKNNKREIHIRICYGAMHKLQTKEWNMFRTNTKQIKTTQNTDVSKHMNNTENNGE